MAEKREPITTIEGALAWLQGSNFSTLYPSVYADLAKQCARVIEDELDFWEAQTGRMQRQIDNLVARLDADEQEVDRLGTERD